MIFENFYYNKKGGTFTKSKKHIAVFTFGRRISPLSKKSGDNIRFQPPTFAHSELMLKVHKMAEELGGDAYIFTSHTHDGGLSGKKNKGRNPIDWKTKNSFIKKLIPWANISNEIEIKNPFHVINYLKDRGYNKVIFIIGSDRVSEFNERWIPYAKENFNKVSIISAGNRDPNEETTIGMSGTKARHSAKLNNFDEFKKATGWTGNVAKELMNNIRNQLPEDF